MTFEAILFGVSFVVWLGIAHRKNMWLGIVLYWLVLCLKNWNDVLNVI